MVFKLENIYLLTTFNERLSRNIDISYVQVCIKMNLEGV